MASTSISTPLTVVVLTYNSAKLLGACLESLNDQTFKSFEVVILDGGSSDATEIVANSFADSLTIRFIRQRKRGLSQARNEALEAAKGSLVAFLDSDDTAKPDRLEKQVAFMNAHADYVAAGSWLEFIDAQGRSRGIRRYVTGDSEIRRAASCYNPFPNVGMIFRRELALKVGAFQVDPGEDYDFYLRLMQVGKVCNLPEPLTNYRLHEEGSKFSGVHHQLAGSLKIRADAIRIGLVQPSLRGKLSDFVQGLLLWLPQKWVYEVFQWLVKLRKI